MKIQLLKPLLLFSLLPILVFAQDFDESFLKSLPDEVRSDLLDQSNAKDKLEETQYRRPSTFIKKKESNSIRFGAEIFSMMQSTLMPLNEPNFDGSYILDYGDVLEIQLVGQKSSLTKLSLKRDGSINIPDIGKVFLSGISLDKASEIIKIKINTILIGVESFVTLVNVRDIQVIMAGNVDNPGPYTLNGNSNIFHALSVAGGPSIQGSFRSIDLIRDNKNIENIDLYDTFIYGKSNFKTRLRSGDLIFVNPYNNIVNITGAVKRPGEYELKTKEKLSNILLFANGIKNSADLTEIKLVRVDNGIINTLKINNVKDFEKIESSDGDSIFIRNYRYRNVILRGAVENPGIYKLNEGSGILDLITAGGGYSKNAYPFGGILENIKTKEINQLAADKLYLNFLDSILSKTINGSGESSSSENILSMLQQLKNSSISGRVSAEFTLEILRSDPTLDILLQDGDEVTIPEYIDQVYVFGEVPSQGSSRYLANKNYNYYIDQNGGFNDNADKQNIFVIHPDGKTTQFKTNKNLFMRQKNTKIDLYAGSIIFVPRKTDNEFVSFQRAQAYATILGNLGVSLASISVLKD